MILSTKYHVFIWFYWCNCLKYHILGLLPIEMPIENPMLTDLFDLPIDDSILTDLFDIPIDDPILTELF